MDDLVELVQNEKHPMGDTAVRVNGRYICRGDLLTMMTRRDEIVRAFRAAGVPTDILRDS